jgi:hypothetical protein
VTGLLFGFDGLPATALTCVEYDLLWTQFNGLPRRGPEAGRLRPFSSYGDEKETTTAWGFDGQDQPALGERVRTGVGCEHWLFAAERAS